MSRTQYDENERELTEKHLSNFGLNPFALKLLVRSYMANIYPEPILLDYFVEVQDLGQCHFELEIRKPGYLGAKRGNAEALDPYGLRLFCRSYFEHVSPYPVDFFYQGLEIHLRTPGADAKYKNIARDIFNPTD